jgi:hypothetical protein
MKMVKRQLFFGMAAVLKGEVLRRGRGAREVGKKAEKR